MFNWIKNVVLNTKARFQENSVNSVIWLVDSVPYAAGFSIRKATVFVPFWVVHWVLLVYVYFVGTVDFQIRHAQGAGDFIKGYVNISLLILTSNHNYWFIFKRSLLRTVLTLVQKNDELSKESVALRDKYAKCIALVKRIVFIFYALNFIDAIFIYMPNQVDPTNNRYSMSPCVGLGPLHAFPRRQICRVILVSQHAGLVIVALSFQAVLLFLIAHTTAMFHLLTEDMVLFETSEDIKNNVEVVNEMLPIIIRRHTIILETIERIKDLYSVPLGINFGTNGVCILFFFYIPLQEWVKYSPVLIYSFLVFFLYCFLCQRLINEAEAFERAVYSCGWENFNVKNRKLVYVMLLQAQKPILVLAADIIPVNIYTFATAMQGMYKFITVVKV